MPQFYNSHLAKPYIAHQRRPLLHYRQVVLFAVMVLCIILYFSPPKEHRLVEVANQSLYAMELTQEAIAHDSAASAEQSVEQPVKAIPEQQTAKGKPLQKAALVVLIRNSELNEMIGTIEHFEKRFNHQYGYPYIFLNDKDFSKEFTGAIRETLIRLKSKSEARFGKIPVEHWGYPAWINQTEAAETRRRMHEARIIYGGSESYRHMCRYQSGFFMWHSLLDGLEYYWRVEPSTRLLCDIPYDPFEKMALNGWQYGFTVSIGEYRATVPTLWHATMEFVENRKSKMPVYQPELLAFFGNQKEYNMCHFWSNFEIASVKFLRSPEYTEYFKHLDNRGGFFYERWGDAPVHSIATGLFLRKDQVHFFDDIGYFHNPLSNCPAEPLLSQRNCDCKRADSADLIQGWSCVPQWKTYQPTKWFK